MNNVYQSHNVIVVSKLLEHSNFANSSAWDTIVTVVNFDLFDGDCSTCFCLDGFVNDTIGTLTKLGLIIKAVFEFLWGLNRAVIGSSTALCWLLGLFQLLRIFSLWLCVIICSWKLLLDCKGGLSGLNRQLTLDH